MVCCLNNKRGYNNRSIRITPADIKAVRSKDYSNYIVKKKYLKRTEILGL
jgi:hypothetical protein